jgi:CDP-diacylglycerol--glycerol-3-phosphate 3-phosphatidyltransferase
VRGSPDIDPAQSGRYGRRVPRPDRAKPLITANQVTLARLIVLPIGSYLLYQGVRGHWIALVSMTLVGVTDTLDGWLARRQGPTVLGGLMDPIADKVFVAMTMLPALDLGWFPVEIVTLIFLREFVITAARTAYLRRDVALKTSYIAKVKTWYQMIVVALIFLLGISPVTMRWLVLVCAVSPIVGGLAFYAVKRRVWRGSVAFALSFGLVLAFVPFDDAKLIARAPMLAVGLGWLTVAITWYSGGGYLFKLGELVARKPPDAHDGVRLFGAVTMPVFACLLLARHHLPDACATLCFKSGGGWEGSPWPVFSTVALEFAIGGLDNLLAHQKRAAAWRWWGVRVTTQAALLGGALWVASNDGPSSTVNALTLGAFAVTALSALIVFVRFRGAYLGDEPTAETTAKAG